MNWLSAYSVLVAGVIILALGIGLFFVGRHPRGVRKDQQVGE